MMANILLIEDDAELASLISNYLQRHGYQISSCDNGLNGIERALTERPDLVIIDMMLPGTDGLTVLKQLRPVLSAPLLMLTASEDDIDHVAALEIGANDFISKPVSPRVLLARIRSALRDSATPMQKQAGHGAEATVVHLGDISIDSKARCVLLNTTTLDLTDQEFDLFSLLAENEGTPLNREFLTRSLRGLEYDGLDRSIDTIIVRLRKKLGDTGRKHRRIVTIRNKGYAFIATDQIATDQIATDQIATD